VWLDGHYEKTGVFVTYMNMPTNVYFRNWLILHFQDEQKGNYSLGKITENIMY
jgi:hypothetical protein